jgi:hypothetical protein
MFYIDQTTSSFAYAKQEHYNNVSYIIKKKLLGKIYHEPHPKGIRKRINQIYRINSSVADFLNNEENLKAVIVGQPEILNQIKNKFTRPKEIKSIKSLFRYDAFIDTRLDSTFSFYNAYHLAENLNLNTCVYCNRLYTNTIITDTRDFISRPTFDHWFPISTFPLLGLSFYNLIPSCNVCNCTVKGATPYEIEDIFHPYLKHSDLNQILDFKFSYDLEDHLRAKIKLNSSNDFTKRSIEVMKLNEMYSIHADEVRDLIYIKRAYSEGYLNSLRKLLQIPISKEEMYRLAFGVNVEDNKLNLKPFSKLKKDILFELGMI